MTIRQRRRQAVFEYTRNPACIFRLDITRAPRELTLRDGTLVRPGDRVARLHFWNEQIPTLPEDGATIAWARRMQRAIGVSLQELAHYLAGQPDLADIAVDLRPTSRPGRSRRAGSSPASWPTTALRRSPSRIRCRWRERLHRFGENILISLIVLAHNAGALRRDTLRRVRVPIYLSRRDAGRVIRLTAKG